MAGPVISIFCYVLIGLNSDWRYSLFVCGSWILVYMTQFFMALSMRKYSQVEASYNDERIRNINDTADGIRTIKCYAWENFFVDKINFLRTRQKRQICKMNMIRVFALAVLQNAGHITAFLIFLYQWSIGLELKGGNTLSLLAMILHLFANIS